MKNRFELINKKQNEKLAVLVKKIRTISSTGLSSELESIIDSIHENVPEKKRISYGRYSIVKDLGLYMYPLCMENKVKIKEVFSELFEQTEHDQFARSLGIQMLTIYADNSGCPEEVLPYIEKAAMDDDWIVRECCAGFVRKLIVNYTEEMHGWYMKMVKSENPMQRRFACESLRPVADNLWFKKQPDFALSIIEHLFRESEAYPRTSAGNSLSDWMRIDQERTLKTVRKLADSGDKNSYWIACRACRNLVKKEPLLVMDILNTDQYIYKDRKFYRKDYKQ